MNASVSSVTHKLTLRLARPQAEVWRAFTAEVGDWWPADFYATPAPHRMILEAKVGGRLFEDNGQGNGLLWYQVIALEAPKSILLSGVLAPPFGGPATSILRISFEPDGKNATSMEMTDSVFGIVGDPETTMDGWRALFEGGFKAHLEKKPKRAKRQPGGA